MKRLFIAINIPENIRKEIEVAAGELERDFKNENSIRFIDPKNWHLTISFLDYQPDEAIAPIINSTRETAEKFSPPKISFEKIILAPPNKPARMIWLTSSNETSKILGEIKNDLENNLAKNNVKFSNEQRQFNGHVTLARFDGSINYSKRMSEYKNLDLAFTAFNLDLMESSLKPSGAEYEVLSLFPFEENK